MLDRNSVGFFYRFPDGESAADVYDRVSSKDFIRFNSNLLKLLLFDIGSFG